MEDYQYGTRKEESTIEQQIIKRHIIEKRYKY
jgi:hypothetical protein